LKFKNITKSEDGLEFTVETTSQEVEWLVNYAVEDLLKVGILSINPNEGEQEVTLRGVSH